MSEVYRNGTTEEQIEASTTLLGTLGGILKGKAGGIGGVEGVALAGLNWSWKSVKTFGHTFMEHGATVKLLSLADRARSKGFGIGQWTDNAKAS